MPKDKKERELACLKKAFEIGLKGHGGTKHLLKKLNGTLMAHSKEESERPDFVLQLNEADTKFKYLGIEHFDVDQFSEELDKKPGIQQGKSVHYEFEARKIFDDYNNQFDKANICLEDMLNKVAKVTANMSKDQRSLGYASFISHYLYVVNKHLKNIDEYKLNISKRYGVTINQVGIAFLIEIHTDFQTLFLNRQGKIRRCRQGEMPLFERVVQILESLKGKVDYAILVMGSMLPVAQPTVLAIDCRDVRVSLRKQNQPIYIYAGIDGDFEGSSSLIKNLDVNNTVDSDRDGYTFVTDSSIERIDQDTLSYCSFSGAQIAWSAYKTNKSYAADLPVQMIMTWFGDNIIGWKSPNKSHGETYAQPITLNFSNTAAMERMKEFEEKWAPQSENFRIEGNEKDIPFTDSESDAQ